MWKPLSRTQSHITDTTASTASTSGNNTTASFNDDDDDDDRDDDEDFLVGGVQRSDSLPQQVRIFGFLFPKTHILPPLPLLSPHWLWLIQLLDKDINTILTNISIPDSNDGPESVQEDDPAHEQCQRSR